MQGSIASPTGRLYYLWSIGCQMNRADSDRLADGLLARGFRASADPACAELLILNTCVVRRSAEERVIGRLNSLRPLARAGARVVVMGCFVEDPVALSGAYPHVAAFFRPSDVTGVLGFVGDGVPPIPPEALLSHAPVRVSELVPISYGCDHHCTYCIVTLRRGAQRSRAIADIVEQVQAFAAAGTREVTLLGQNVDAYGTDLPGREDLADVLEAVHGVAVLWRIRFLTSHPRDMTQRIIDAVASLPKVCPCWELAVQSGDDEVLRRMGRGYTREHFEHLVSRIRRAASDSALNTDIIVGFPGETEAQYLRTLDLVQATRFDMVHVAAYSVRPGTAAALWPDDVPPDEKERRRAAIEQAQEQIASERNHELLGKTLEVLVDGRQKGRWRGRTRGNKLVFFESTDNWLGRMASVSVTWAGPWSMLAELREPEPARSAPGSLSA